MIRAFLSHSSVDKNSYVKIVADKLGEGFSVYDDYTFEAGMQPFEEILKGLEESQIFVMFISDTALNSDWVTKELELAHQRLADNLLKRIFPIIIDSKITYQDHRIPQWMKDEYNVKYVSRPVVAARRIKQRLREVSWLKNPRLRERDLIFVGRNDLIDQLEMRVDDVDQQQPTCFIASGLPRIGRGSLLRHGVIKCNISKQSYEFPSIVLRREDSLDDFLLKLYELGLSNIGYPKNLMDQSSEERIELAERIVRDILYAQEIIVIHDEGCVINYTCTLQSWFDEILRRVATKEKTTFLISARYRLRPEYLRQRPYVFSLSIPELNYQERNGLFKRLVGFENLALSRDDFSFFSGLFQGFPDQMQFTCDLIRDYGVQGARRKSHLITEFNSDRATTIIEKYTDKEEVLDFLYMLSEFEFISFDFLFSLVSEDKYGAMLEQMLAESICDYVGMEKEFIRLNDVIRDFVRRNRLEMPKQFQGRLKDHLRSFLSDDRTDERDISDIRYSMKEGIKAGQVVPEAYLIPSHFLTSMRELYQEKGHLDRVIELADLLLQKRHLLENTVEQDVRYYLCLSLARKKDDRFLKEVMQINGPEHNFLLGFFYRLQRRAEDAITKLKICLEEPIVSNRAKRELVQVYLSIEDYRSASDLARDNYESNRSNPYHIQAYFNTIVNSPDANRYRDLLACLIDELRSVGSEIAVQMACIAESELLSKCDGNYPAAADAIDDTVRKYPDAHYPLISKAFLAAHNQDLDSLKSAYHKLVELSKERTLSEDTMIRIQAYILAMEGNSRDAVKLVEKKLNRLPAHARSSFIRKLEEAHELRFGNAQ